MTTHRLIRGSAILFFDRLVRMALGFMVGIVLARSYGPQGYGILSYLIALTAVGGSLASLGLDELLPRDLASGVPGLSQSDIMKTGAILRFLGECTALIGLVSLLHFLPATQETRMLGSLLGLYYLFQVTDVIEFSLRVEGQFLRIAGTRISASLLSAALKVGLAVGQYPLWTLILAMLLEYAASAVFFGFSLGGHGTHSQKGRFHGPYAKSLLRRALPLVLAGGLSLLQTRLDTFLVEAHWDSEVLGRYAASLRITELLDSIAIVLSVLLIPEFGRRRGDALDQAVETAYLSGTLLFLAACPFLALMAHFFETLYGQAYAGGGDLILWLALRPYLYLLGVIRIAALVSQGRTGVIPLYPFLAILSVIALFDPLSSRYGLEGAAMAGGLGLLAANVVGDLLVNPSNLVRILRSPLALPSLWQSLRSDLFTRTRSK